jgi:PqqD family protein of HPr-rel-A system
VAGSLGKVLLWKGLPSDSLLWVEWEGEFSVYHRNTGETHILSLLPSELLRFLENRSLTLEHLSSELATLCQVECNADWQNRIERMLHDLAALSLIEKES